MKINDHLGGHQNVTNVDEELLKLAKEMFGIKNMLDIGCGPGGMENICNNLDISWTGIDGDPNVSKENIITHDFTTGPLRINQSFDLVWSVEFLEHVEEKYISNFMPLFTLGNVCIVTAALPNTPGKHHVNCKENKYWIDIFNQYGFDFDENTTIIFKNISTMRKDFFKKSGMVFRKIEKI